MISFRYTAVDRQGTPQTGILRALSQEAATLELHQRGVVPIELRTQATQSWRHAVRLPKPAPRSSNRDRLAFIEQLSALTAAGVQIDRALAIARDIGDSAAIRACADELLQAVRRGQSFSEALARRPEMFDASIVGLVSAGEAAGQLQNVLQRIAVWLGRMEDTRERLRASLLYPTILLVVMLSTLVLVTSVVLPRFESLFAEAGQSLPWATRAVLTFGHVVSDYSMVWIPFLLVALVALRILAARPGVRSRLHAQALRLPLLGTLIQKMEVARVLATCATLVASGLPLPRALSLSAASSRNHTISESTQRIALQLREGSPFAALLARSTSFPKVAVQLVQVGEETGQLEVMLQRAADMLDHDAQLQLQRVLALVVPVVTVLMGLLVAGLIGSVLVGILSINDLAI